MLGMDPADYSSHATNVQPASGWQKPANELWPKPEVARRLNDVDIQKQIPVTVRLEYDTGTEHQHGVATRWTASHVYVVVSDERLHSGGCWVRADDVVRR